MKKMTTIFGLILSVSLILTSCGGSSTESTEGTEGTEGTETESGEVAEEGSSSDCDQFLADYETFVDSYISMAKKIQEDPTDMSAMTEYTSMMSKLTEMQSQGADCNDAEVALKMTELNLKIAQAASSM
jgi:hypothetical protein